MPDSTALPLRKMIEKFLSKSRTKGVANDQGVTLGTTIGPVREENQDRLAYVEANGDAPYRLAIVSDGMGGLLRGSEAAEVVVASFVSAFHCSPLTPTPERLHRAADEANQQTYARLHGEGGATIAAVVIDSNAKGYGVTVGDSRIYSIDLKNQLVQVSRDDTVGEILNARPNDIDPYFDKRLIQFVGMGDGVEPNIYPVENVNCKALLLTSDGVHGIGNDVLDRVVSAQIDKGALVEALMAVANAFGGFDNSSVALMSNQKPVEDLEGDTLRIVAPHGVLFYGFDRTDMAEHGAPPLLVTPTAKSPNKQPRKRRQKKKPAELAKGPGALDFDFSDDN